MENHYQRAERRAIVYGGGSLTWDDAANGSRTSSVIVRNLSGEGLQIVCHQAIRTGAVVFLTGETYECLGKVRYCVYGEDGYRIGIQFTREPYLRRTEAAAIV